ncbi:MAG: radical SAM family heme chaperone HemW [Gammaproteobacteria bacterium]
MTDSLPPLSLYVHLPWCVRKCPYCDFNSYRAESELPEAAYVDALLRDLDAERDAANGRKVQSIYVGGGTPSLFSGDAVARLLDGIRARVDLEPDAEITLEANPGVADAARFAAFREAGVNRLSIGVQSFRDAQLAALGRVHDGREAVRAVEAARRAGFADINVDLMYGLPDDSLEAATSDVRRAIALEPTHISWYQLTLEPGTAFHRRPPALPDDDTVLEIEAAGRDLLASAGYERYEVSAYAKPGHRCRHNLNYWQFGDYVGIGAGAHGKLTRARGEIERRAKARNPRTYVELAGTPAAAQIERVVGPDLVLELLMNALRLPEGVPVSLFEARTGRSIATIRDRIDAAVSRGWMVDDPDRLATTPRGLELLNDVLALFVPAPVARRA